MLYHETRTQNMIHAMITTITIMTKHSAHDDDSNEFEWMPWIATQNILKTLLLLQFDYSVNLLRQIQRWRFFRLWHDFSYVFSFHPQISKTSDGFRCHQKESLRKPTRTFFFAIFGAREEIKLQNFTSPGGRKRKTLRRFHFNQVLELLPIAAIHTHSSSAAILYLLI